MMHRYYILDLEVSDTAIDDPTVDYDRALDELESSLQGLSIDCSIVMDPITRVCMLLISDKQYATDREFIDSVFEEVGLAYTVR